VVRVQAGLALLAFRASTAKLRAHAPLRRSGTRQWREAGQWIARRPRGPAARNHIGTRAGPARRRQQRYQGIVPFRGPSLPRRSSPNVRPVLAYRSRCCCGRRAGGEPSWLCSRIRPAPLDRGAKHDEDYVGGEPHAPCLGPVPSLPSLLRTSAPRDVVHGCSWAGAAGAIIPGAKRRASV